MKEKIFIIIILLVLIGVFIMTGIVHKTVKSSGEKGLATEWNDDHEITGDIDQDQNQFLNQVIENRTDFPAGPVEGQIVYRSDLNVLYIYSGAAWVIFVDENNIDNHVGIPKGTHYWSCAGVGFRGVSLVNAYLDFRGIKQNVAGVPVEFKKSVSLPHGAVVTGVIVYGTDVANTWSLIKTTLDGMGVGTTMANANIDTEDVTITEPTIDNSLNKYWLSTTISNGEWCNGARITYTL